jgi:hypothetical protein
MEEQLKLLLQVLGTDSVTAAIAELRALKEQTGQLTEEQQTALSSLETYANFTKDIGTAEGAAADAALELARDQRIANDILVEAKAQVDELAGTGGDEGGGFRGMAGAALKGEKAITSLASGHGLGRLGSMLEGVLAPTTGIPGIGLAIGATVYAIEAMIPAIEKMVESFGAANTAADKASDAIFAFNNASLHGPTRQKRQLAKIDSEIAKLEDKEDEGGGLSDDDQLALTRLRKASARGHDSIERDEKFAQYFVDRDKEQALIKKNLADQDKKDAAHAQAAEAKRERQQEQEQRKAEQLKEKNARETDAEVSSSMNWATSEENREARQRESLARKQAAQKQRDVAAQIKLDEQAAHDASPRGQLEAAQKLQRGQVEAAVMDQWARGGKQESPEFVQNTIRQATANLPETGGNLAAAIQMAVQAGYRKAIAAQQKDAQRLQVFSESYYGN